MKSKFLLLLFLLGSGLTLSAQNISVKDFYYAENDLTARYHGTSVEDQNGNICALIKVETTEKGLWSFDVGALGVTKTEFQNAVHPAEIWVWVPFGVTWISIQHEQLGKLNRYNFPHSIDKGCTYIMKLTTGKVKTIVEETVNQQYLTFQISPSYAVLEVNGELWAVNADGSSTKFVDFGTYNYRVQAPNYHSEVGKITVNDPEKTHKVPISLKPDFVEVTLKVDADAEIWVNNEMKGKRIWTGPLGKGVYKIDCKQSGHETSSTSQKITAEMDGYIITLPVPQPIYGSLNVESTPNYATIYIDGKAMDETPKFIHNLLVGQHELRLSKDGYVDHVETITLTKGERKQVNVIMSAEKNDQPSTPINTKKEQTFIVNGISFTLKLVEGGSFQMGATSEQGSETEEDETPVHVVKLSSYYLGETEVTQALWKAVMDKNPSYFKDDNLPVEKVSWNDCQEFIQILNQKTGKNFRLPTEAEWEYAARGGTKSNGNKYSGSNNVGKVAWYADNSNGKTHAVKTKEANVLGLYDMSGNVWEWCSDWYGNDYYSISPSTNPQGSSSGLGHVLRGGSWHSNEWRCRVSYRDSNGSNSKDRSYGFRLCLPQ